MEWTFSRSGPTLHARLSEIIIIDTALHSSEHAEMKTNETILSRVLALCSFSDFTMYP